MGFKQWISEIRSNGSTNCAAITHLNKMYPTVKLPTFGTVVKWVKSSSSNPSPGIIQRKDYEFFVTILNANRLSFNLIKTSSPPQKKRTKFPQKYFYFLNFGLVPVSFVADDDCRRLSREQVTKVLIFGGGWRLGKSAVKWVTSAVWPDW